MPAISALALGAVLAAAGAATGEAALPSPGSYTLQHIMPSPEGKVLDTQGKRVPLSRFTTGKVTLLSLIYTRCGDGTGCPLATHQMQQLKGRLDAEPGMSGRVRFVSLSFDPGHDTPEVMRAYAARYLPDEGGLPWHFLTTGSRAGIRPLLEGFGQDVWTRVDGSGDGALPHVLKIFLIDRFGSVREIYSTSYLRPPVLLNDIRTLLMEERSAPAAAGAAR
jgi:cytochrome oxidase Cu insertion factor (SCO1/SenC/PrrC family)